MIATSRNNAKEIAQGAGGGKTPIHEVDKKTGEPHYHTHDRSGGHVLYSIASALSVEHWGDAVGDEGFANFGWMVDLVNPLTLPKDILDVKAAICGEGDDD